MNLRGLLSTHPVAAARRVAVDDPGRLFRFGFWEAAAVGVAISFTYALLTLALNLSSVPLGEALGAPALILAVVAGGLLTLALWRGRTYALVNQLPPPSILRPAAGLTAGLVVGALLANPRAGVSVPVAAVTGAALAVVAGWISGLAAAWVPAVRGRSLGWAWPAAAVAAATVIAAVFELWLAPDGLRGYYGEGGALWAGPYIRAEDIGWAGPFWLWNAAFVPFALGAAAIRLGFVALLLLWAVPVAGWIRPAPAGPIWLRRALPRESDPAPLPLSVPRIGYAAAAGAVAGGIAFASQFALRAALHASLPMTVRRADAFVLLITYWELGIAVLAQAIVAGFVAGTTRRCGLVLGMLAASVTAGLAALGVIVSTRVGSCVTAFSIRPHACQLRPDGDFIALILQLIVLDGGAAALLTTLVVTGIRAALRRWRDRRPPWQAAGPVPMTQSTPSPRFRPTAMVSAAAVLVVATVMAWADPASGGGSAEATALLSPVQSGEAVTAWWNIGGKDLTIALARDAEAIGKAADQSSPTAMRSACTTTQSDAMRAIGFAPVPDKTIQQEWSRGVTEFRRGATDCLSSLSGVSGSASRAVTEMLNGARALTQAIDGIQAIVKSPDSPPRVRK